MSVNAGVWSQLEAAVRQIAAESDAIYVFTGSISIQQTSNSSVPVRLGYPATRIK